MHQPKISILNDDEFMIFLLNEETYKVPFMVHSNNKIKCFTNEDIDIHNIDISNAYPVYYKGKIIKDYDERECIQNFVISKIKDTNEIKYVPLKYKQYNIDVKYKNRIYQNNYINFSYGDSNIVFDHNIDNDDIQFINKFKSFIDDVKIIYHDIINHKNFKKFYDEFDKPLLFNITNKNYVNDVVTILNNIDKDDINDKANKLYDTVKSYLYNKHAKHITIRGFRFSNSYNYKFLGKTFSLNEFCRLIVLADLYDQFTNKIIKKSLN
jgi:hypothetical protein